MVTKIALGILLATVAGAASATAPSSGLSCTTEYLFGFIPYEVCTIVKSKPPTVVAAPEIDSSSAIAGLTLMLGGLAILSSRRKKNIEG
jgi:LPXTG-motif cell wall-anchored protein